MILGFAKENYPGEKRVALVPNVLAGLQKAGFEIVFETGAGMASGFPDSAYLERGAKVVPGRNDVIRAADIMLYVRTLGANRENSHRDIELFHRDQTIIGMLDPSNSEPELKLLAEKGVAAFALELLPRITRAQSMDVLSSMATVAGYKAVLLAANALPKMFPLLMTAAGTVSPAHVFVIGAGVAGLQAIATAKRLGAIVRAYDIRPAVKEQVESLGAKFVELPLETGQSETSGGYAKAMDEEFYRRQRELMTRILTECQVVICTAAVPGKRAPILITEAMVGAMKPGSVIVDLAAEQGGNCELTKAGETITIGEIQVIGPVNLASSLPYDSSQLYARNITNFLLHLVGPDGKLRMVADDEIVRTTLATGPAEPVVPATPNT
jgi:NAD(P) transhydrogenase subunit alpha